MGKGCPKDGKGVLYYRQTRAVDLLIEIEGEDIGHAADEIDDSHDAGFEIVGLDVVLAADTAEELFGVETLGMHGCLNHLLHEGVDDAITGKLDVDNRLAVVYLLIGSLGTTLICLALTLGYVFYELAFEGAVKDFLLVLEECLRTYVFKLSYGTGTHIHHLLVLIGQVLVGNALQDVLLDALFKESEEQSLGFLEGEDFKLVSVLNVHYLIADIVGCLYEIYERVTGVFQRLALVAETLHAQFLCYTSEIASLGVEESELAVVACT